jgi:hypothetical protein
MSTMTSDVLLEGVSFLCSRLGRFASIGSSSFDWMLVARHFTKGISRCQGYETEIPNMRFSPIESLRHWISRNDIDY